MRTYSSSRPRATRRLWTTPDSSSSDTPTSNRKSTSACTTSAVSGRGSPRRCPVTACGKMSTPCIKVKFDSITYAKETLLPFCIQGLNNRGHNHDNVFVSIFNFGNTILHKLFLTLWNHWVNDFSIFCLKNALDLVFTAILYKVVRVSSLKTRCVQSVQV